MSAPSEPIYDGTNADPTEAEVRHLCSVWAEVGQAILVRRKASSETKPI